MNSQDPKNIIILQIAVTCSPLRGRGVRGEVINEIARPGKQENCESELARPE